VSDATETETAAEVPRPLPLRRNHGFRMLWIGQLLSDSGSEVGMLAYPLLILALTHSAVLAGVVGTAREIALIGLQLPAGALSDRLDRRLTMIICDTMRAVMLALLGVLIALDLASWPVVLVVSVIEGGASAIFTPASTAALPQIVPDSQLEEAWAATEARTWGAGLAGPAIGGVLFGLGRAVPFLADALSYGISFGTVSRIRGRFRPDKAAERKPLWREAADGLRFAWQAAPLALLLVLAPAANAAMFAVMLRSTPEEMRGRVINTTGMAAMSLAAMAPLIAGLLVEHVSDAWAMGAFAATSGVAAVLYLTMPGVRPAER
jgi:MFS family permease